MTPSPRAVGGDGAVAKADLVPAGGERPGGYGGFGELARACEQFFCAVVNGRVHRETCAVPGATAGDRAGPAAPAAAGAAYRRARHDPDGEHRPDDPGLRQRAVFDPAGGGRGGRAARTDEWRGRGPGGAAAAPGLAGDGPLGLSEVAGIPPVGAGEPVDRNPADHPDHPQSARRYTAGRRGSGLPRRRRRRSWPSATAPWAWLTEAAAAGASRSARRWPRPSSSPRWPGRPRSMPRWAPPRWQAGSATVTCCPSPGSRPLGPLAVAAIADEAYFVQRDRRPGPVRHRGRARQAQRTAGGRRADRDAHRCRRAPHARDLVLLECFTGTGAAARIPDATPAR